MTTFDVALSVYDISDGLAKTWSPVLLGKRIEGVWHTGVQVYGMEYFYGGGIVKMKPCDVTRIYGLTPLRTHSLGVTTTEQRDFERYLISIQGSFHRQCYDIIKWNCNNFSDHVCHYLMDKGIPRYIMDLPESITNTFMGKIIVNCIRKFSDAPAIDSDAAEHPKQILGVPGNFNRGRRNSCPSSPTSRQRSSSQHTQQQQQQPLPTTRKVRASSTGRRGSIEEPPRRQQRRCSVPCILPGQNLEEDVLTPAPVAQTAGRRMSQGRRRGSKVDQRDVTAAAAAAPSALNLIPVGRS